MNDERKDPPEQAEDDERPKADDSDEGSGLEQARQHLAQAVHALRAHRTGRPQARPAPKAGATDGNDTEESDPPPLVANGDDLKKQVSQARQAVRRAEKAAERARALLSEANKQSDALERREDGKRPSVPDEARKEAADPEDGDPEDGR